MNNAGVGSVGNFQETPLDLSCDIIDLNINSVVKLTRLLLPHMNRQISNRGKRILMIGSIAGCAPGPSSAVYSASKAFLGSFTLALRRELLNDGVIVSLAMPGPVKTKFIYEAGAENSLIFKTQYIQMSSIQTAKLIYRGMIQGRDVIVPGVLNKIYTYLISKFLPTTIVAEALKLAWTPYPTLNIASVLSKVKSRINTKEKTPSNFQFEKDQDKIQSEVNEPEYNMSSTPDDPPYPGYQLEDIEEYIDINNFPL